MSGTITLRAAQADWLIRAAIVAASKDDVTPVLCAVQWAIADGRATLTATDRYRAHQAYAPLVDDDADNPAAGSFLMDRAQAALLLKMIPRRDPAAKVTLTWTDAEPLPAGHSGKIAKRHHGTITWLIEGGKGETFMHEAPQVRGNFPPVGRLFPDEGSTEGEAVAQIGLSPALLADTRWLRSGHGSLRFIVPRTTESVKLGPMLVVNTEGTARALIQPNVLVGESKRYGA
ncbi:hypothetical protein A9Z40_02980 [Microbacterium arborescens]|uniref:DNA polymerase III beta sliding clamp central domain-containing protein n=1 Tax=Microbacterium arborescens TaxID=33883 RepID=A0ABX2WI76_9MICO|nr:hypothetical protein [Microbacterium arborescens]OAZ40920.1 hypothetical protein A9Z40_02980 [Microbacterium arborescens]